MSNSDIAVLFYTCIHVHFTYTKLTLYLSDMSTLDIFGSELFVYRILVI